MSNPWDIKTGIERSADTVYNFIIFCEDEHSERIYFESFENEKVIVNVIAGQGSRIENVANAKFYFEDLGLYDNNTNSLLFENGTQVWCVYDCDVQSGLREERLMNYHFDISIKEAQSLGINVAWSNDAFELWILLHLQDVEISEDYSLRSKYYDLLKEYFKTLETNDELLQKLQDFPSFGYKNDLKSRKRFPRFVMPILINETKRSQAIERAKILEAYFESVDFPFHQRKPCTKIHHLVQELLQYGSEDVA